MPPKRLNLERDDNTPDPSLTARKTTAPPPDGRVSRKANAYPLPPPLSDEENEDIIRSSSTSTGPSGTGLAGPSQQRAQGTQQTQQQTQSGTTGSSSSQPADARTDLSSSSREVPDASLLAPLINARNAAQQQQARRREKEQQQQQAARRPSPSTTSSGVSAAPTTTTSSNTGTSPFKRKSSTSNAGQGQGGKGKGKTTGSYQSGGKRRPDDTTTTQISSRSDGEESEDDSSIPRVRSTSHRGYLWRTEKLDIRPEDVKRRIKYHNSIKATIEREGKNEIVKFRRGDKIWVCPDPAWLEELPEDGPDLRIAELPEEEWWTAEILDCCALDQSQYGEKTLGILRIKWFYSPDHCTKISSLHRDYIKKIRAYRFDENELIDSDHVDFIGIDTFAGFADQQYAYVRLSGLEVDDEDRMRPESKRKPPRKNLYTRMVGWTLKVAAEREAEKQAFAGRTESARDAKRRKVGTQNQSQTQDQDTLPMQREDSDDRL